MPLLLFICLFLIPLSLQAQVTQDQPPGSAEPVLLDAQLHAPSFTPAEARLAGFEQRSRLRHNSLLANLELRPVGPTVMSGRVTDLDISPTDPTHFYVAYASGGLWKTTSNGSAFTPLFDNQAVMTLGDIAVDWKHSEVIWIGTGENNSSRSSYAGTGLYKSDDQGQSWQHMGLAETHHIGRIILHPDDPNTVWMAAIGHLYSSNPERGIYKTTDGGASWEHTLYIDDETGVIDLIIDPTDPNILYATAWHRSRRAWDFVEGGSTSGIYKSTDAGATWTLLTDENSGFPTGDGVGRIGLTVYPGNPNILYALLDNQQRRPEDEDEDQPALTRNALRTMTKADFLEQVTADDLTEYLEENNFPDKYEAETIIEQIRNDELAPPALVEYLEDANQQLFDTPVIGAEVYRSDDAGRTWTRTHEDFLDNVYFSYGYYFGEIRVAPQDPERIYVLGVPLLKSEDGGRTFVSISQENVHADHQALWVNPNRNGHLINGNDGGLNMSYDDGETWFKLNIPPVGQFYTVGIDHAEPYNVYGGLQDNGVWFGPSTYSEGVRWHQSGHYPYESLVGGDGMQVEVDPRDNTTIYTGTQFGNYVRIERDTGRRTRVKPQHELGERPLRFNWQTPIHLSRHNRDILYMGSNKLHRSMNRGEDFEAVSGDLTRGGREGNVPYGTLTTIDESPLRFGVIYVGSDDGLIHVSKDGGVVWTRISDQLPVGYEEFWVSRVEASNHSEGRVYVALNGYRWDHFEAVLFRSDGYGNTWEQLGTDLPAEPVNVIQEDPENPDVLYVGTDHGLYVSIDRGATFMAMFKGMPAAPVHDVKVHERERDLVVGTHGRSLFIANVEHVQQLAPELLAETIHSFDIEEIRYNENWGRQFSPWQDPNEPDGELVYYAGQTGEVVVHIKTEDDTIVQTLTDAAERGLNYMTYNLDVDPEPWNRYRQENDLEAAQPAENGRVYLEAGTYSISFSMDGVEVSETLVIEDR